MHISMPAVISINSAIGMLEGGFGGSRDVRQ